ncbi:DUF4132 domain-containing protein [Novosphingobium sp. SG707]|uniref:DUF4132 domain-containing protein n=1 Tax=Novosphingobium sp. SG707 TaxID=2586996 RepID=UPI001446F7A1|nr:DUF4132 domain-containing protein [Novosphingobium sp. SG707]
MQKGFFGGEAVALGIWDRFKTSLGLVYSASGEGTGRAPISKVEQHFSALSTQERGLPQQIAAHVCAGGHASLVLKLNGNAVQQAWRTRHRVYPVRDENALFTVLADWRVDQMMRLGEVLAALDPITYDWSYFGTKKSPDWLRHVVTLWLGHGRKNQPVETLEELVAHGELGFGAVLDIVFCRDAAQYGSNNSVDRFMGTEAFLRDRTEAVSAAMADLSVDVRAEVIASIGRFAQQAPYLAVLLEAAIGSSKKVRTAARQALTGTDGAALATCISERFATGAPGARAELVEVAALTLGELAAPTLERLREGETSAKVVAAFQRSAGGASPPGDAGQVSPLRPDGAEGYNAVDGTWVALPSAAPAHEATPFDRGVFEILAPAAEEFNRMLIVGKKEAEVVRWHWSKSFSVVNRGALERIAVLAESTYLISTNQSAVGWLNCQQFRHPAVDQFFDDPRVSTYHLVRFALGASNRHFFNLFNGWAGPAGGAIQRRLAAGLDIRTLYEMWIANGGNEFVRDLLTQRWYAAQPDWDLELWPLLVDRLAMLDEALGMAPQSGSSAMRVTAGLEMLGHFPKLPVRYRSRLLILANETSSHVRTPARALLAGTPGLGDAIARQLEDGRQDVRALAADWLARRGERGEVPAIRRALAKEKSDLVRAAMISSLERLGEDVTVFFAQDTMLKEARAGLAKLKIKALDWFQFDRLPQLTWENGDPVDPMLPRWWVMLAGKLKQPGGNALMSLWLARLVPGDAHKLGWMVLTSWIDEDTRTPSDEEANAYAAANVAAVLQSNIANAKRWPQSADYFPTDRDVVFARLKASKAGQYLGSAIDSKGILALCVRVNGVDAAQRARAFLKNHGARVAQSKALLEALAANGSSAALQVVLAAANRSKQKSVQAYAGALIDAIADQNGWSAAQLADRTVPTAGFDADGVLELDCGEGRAYVARLDEQDALVLFNADGREVKALPGPRIDEERPLVEAAKKLLSNARKETKQVFAAQTERLKEAMCLQRNWPREDWESFVAGHPLVGRIAARLVWRGYADDTQPLALFRPLGDGSYTDAEDGDVDIAAFAEIRLVHSSLLDAATIEAWRRHLGDYAVQSPFDQLGRDLPQLDPADFGNRSINDREGWMIETFKLRGVATKLGWQRGPAQDGGWFLTYEKTYREAGLQVEIEFTGSPLPEENRPSALQSLHFRKLRGSGSGGTAMVLRDVPPAVLAECWRDYYDFAAKGTGFDIEWKKKAYA